MSEIGTAYSKFKDALSTLMGNIDDRMVELKKEHIEKWMDTQSAVQDYLALQSMNTVMKGTAFTTAVNEILNGANLVINDGMTEANFAVNQVLTNIQNDYSAGLNAAIEQLNSDVSDITNWTDAMNDEYTLLQTNIASDIESDSETFSQKVELFITEITEITTESSTAVSQDVADFVGAFPALELTGFVQLPPALVRGESNKFRIGVKNTGGGDWLGWLGIKLLAPVDGEIVEFSSNSRPANVVPLQSNSTEVYPVNVSVPDELVAGSGVSLYLIINTL